MKPRSASYLLAAAIGVAAALLSGPTSAETSSKETLYELKDVRGAAALPDIEIGNPYAKEVLIAYLAPTDPFTAQFFQRMYPKIKREILDRGDAHLIIRHYANSLLSLGAIVLIYSLPKDQQLDGLMFFSKLIDDSRQKSSKQIEHSKLAEYATDIETRCEPKLTSMEALRAFAKHFNISDAEFNRVLSDNSTVKLIMSQSESVDKKYEITRDYLYADGRKRFFFQGKFSGDLPDHFWFPDFRVP